MSASGNPALVMRRKKHTEKEVHAHLISVVSVRLREGYTIRDISLTKGKSLYSEVRIKRSELFAKLLEFIICCGLFRRDPAGGEVGSALETQHAY